MMCDDFWKVTEECRPPKDLDDPAWCAVHQHPVIRKYELSHPVAEREISVSSQTIQPSNDGAGTKVFFREVLSDYAVNNKIPRILLELHIEEMEALMKCTAEWRSNDHISEKLKNLFTTAVEDLLHTLKQNLDSIKHPDSPTASFKRSVDKSRIELAFVPTNLHLQSFIISHSLESEIAGTAISKRKETSQTCHDVVTVGAFTVQFILHDPFGLSALWSRCAPPHAGSSCTPNGHCVDRHSVPCDPAHIKYPAVLQLLRTIIRLSWRIHFSEMHLSIENTAALQSDVAELYSVWGDFQDQGYAPNITDGKTMQDSVLSANELRRILGDIAVSAFRNLDVIHAFQLLLREYCVFSQLVTAVVGGILTRLYTKTLLELHCETEGSDSVWNCLLYFESLLSCWDDEKIMIEDVIGAMALLDRTEFVVPFSDEKTILDLEAIKLSAAGKDGVTRPVYARVTLPPLSRNLFEKSPSGANLIIRPHPIFLNVGINEKATIAENMESAITLQKQNNHFYGDRLVKYASKHRDISNIALKHAISQLDTAMRSEEAKNTSLLRAAEKVAHSLGGIRFTMCKSAKDRTAMAVTLEQLTLASEYLTLSPKLQTSLLNEMRTNGTRRENATQNIGFPKYAFTQDQIDHFPPVYRAPNGTFGKAET